MTRSRLFATGPNVQKQTVLGFWDGDRDWKVRFMPDQAGTWRYRTKAEPTVGGLHNQTGSFAVKAATGSDNPFLKHGVLRVSDSGRYLQHRDGTPFFWLLDTAWNGALKSEESHWGQYLRHRIDQEFTGIQFVTTQWRAAVSDRKGQIAYSGYDNITIHPEFFQRLDQRVDAVNDAGLLAAPVLLWALGDKEEVPGKLPEDQAILLARYITARYGAHHVVWFLAGDENFSGDNGPRWERIGRGVFKENRRGLVTLHPQGRQWHFERFLDEDWFDLIIYQSSHGGGPNTLGWLHSGSPYREWRQSPARPIINSEPGYEDHVAWERKEVHTAFDIRQQSYYSLLASPTAGVSYGAHGIWSWEYEPAEPRKHQGTGIAQPWHKAMRLPGSDDLRRLAALFTSVDWWTLRPDQELIADQPGGKDPMKHVAAARSENGDLAVVYLPHGGKIALRTDRLNGTKSNWFNPRNGESQAATPVRKGIFSAPDSKDWVLLIK